MNEVTLATVLPIIGLIIFWIGYMVGHKDGWRNRINYEQEKGYWR